MPEELISLLYRQCYLKKHLDWVLNTLPYEPYPGGDEHIPHNQYLQMCKTEAQEALFEVESQLQQFLCNYFGL